MQEQHFADGWILVCVLLLAGATVNVSEAGETLYNGIRLPSHWPPTIKKLGLEPMPVPYLKSPPAVIIIDVGRQLFVDDFLIEQTTLKRTFHTVEPYEGNPILEPDKPWESEGQWKGRRGSYAMPFSDGVWYDPKDKLFKMWYMGGLLYSTCYATSKDGIHWKKPILDVKAGTNIVHPGNRDSATVWLDLEEKDPARRYKLFRFQKTPRRGFVLHFSPDGIHWSDEIAWAGPCHDRTTAFYNPFREMWVCSIKGAIPMDKPKIRVRRYHEGPDPISAMRWSSYGEPTFWVRGDKLDPKHPDYNVQPQTYCVDAVAYESIMLGLFSIWQGPAKKEIGRPKRNEVFAGFSRDGFHWYRPFRKPIISVSERKGDWNWGNVQSVGGCCLVVGDKLYIYHSGRAGNPQKDTEKNYWDSGGSTGLGFLRRDGFASMDAAAKEGMLLTRPLRFSGKYMFVNADADEGELTVEVLDKTGKVIEPFSRRNCLPVSTDKTLQPVKWKGARDLSALAGKVVKFRFHLKDGRLYAFWVSPKRSGASYGYVAAGGPGFTGIKDTVGSAGYRQ